MSGQLEGESHVDGDDVIEIKEEDPAPESPALGNIIPSNKPRERIFFFKRFFDGHPRLDVLLEIGAGQLHPVTNKEEFAIWEACDDLYIYRRDGPEVRLLQSVGTVEYQDPLSQVSKVKHNFAQKTCGFVGVRDSNGQLQVLKLAISGTSFHPRRERDKKDFLFNAKWQSRVKHFAKRMNINLRTIYDGHSQKATPESIGNWRAGHIEKKLSTHIVWTFLATYGLVDKTRKVSLQDLHQLRQRLRQEGRKPHFELHLSRAPCGTPQRPGRCVPFVQRLSQLTGVHFTIHSWEENVILDGSVPAKRATREVSKAGPQDLIECPSVYDSEGDELEAFLDDNEAQANIVFDGFEEAMPRLEVSTRAARRFGESIEKFRRQERHIEDITKPYPPTPVSEEQFQQMNPYGRASASSRSHFWEDSSPLSSRRQSVAYEENRKRRARKLEARRRRSAASASEVARHSTEMSALAGRLGSLLNSSRLLR
ncbi:hypothetical protein LX32DRAFT_688833 [Colletotrichum zoysiae]|uniref:Uncharacterized protein n=1 Tax=Colletotrichum zoysiae TaxID=1216348 RepID=A0AAD9M6I0_9PEZI|nr:hypothetical protein LX32DRAFT_688833 [Colletotrichum zoysiae]